MGNAGEKLKTEPGNNPIEEARQTILQNAGAALIDKARKSLKKKKEMDFTRAEYMGMGVEQTIKAALRREMTKEVTTVRALLYHVTKDGEIYIALSKEGRTVTGSDERNYVLALLGGSLEDQETLETSLMKELNQEAGISTDAHLTLANRLQKKGFKTVNINPADYRGTEVVKNILSTEGNLVRESAGLNSKGTTIVDMKAVALMAMDKSELPVGDEVDEDEDDIENGWYLLSDIMRIPEAGPDVPNSEPKFIDNFVKCAIVDAIKNRQFLAASKTYAELDAIVVENPKYQVPAVDVNDLRQARDAVVDEVINRVWAEHQGELIEICSEQLAATVS